MLGQSSIFEYTVGSRKDFYIIFTNLARSSAGPPMSDSSETQTEKTNRRNGTNKHDKNTTTKAAQITTSITQIKRHKAKTKTAKQS